jgi:betaine reductase
MPSVAGVACMLFHVPGLVAHGSKPSREIGKDPAVWEAIRANLRSYGQALGYGPHQVFIGNLTPGDLWQIPRPWPRHLLEGAQRSGPFGEIMSEAEFLGLLKIWDEFDLVRLEQGFTRSVAAQLAAHPLMGAADIERLGEGVPVAKIEAELAATPDSVPFRLPDGTLVGCLLRGHEDDLSLTGPILLENLATKVSGIMAMRQLLNMTGVASADVNYVFGFGEEASGDRYQRGGGSMAKAMAAWAGCDNATGGDVKAYCCAPIHAMTLAGATVQAGLYDKVVTVGGGSLAKLGMKYQGHLRAGLPVLEDVLAAIAVLITGDDGVNPVLRMDVVGRQPIGAASGPQAMAENMVVAPLTRAGLKLTDVDRYAMELHDPDVTETAGSGNVPRNNYRIVGALAAMRGEIEKSEVGQFERTHGMPGFSPTQGHIAAGIPYLAHARRAMLNHELQRAMFVAKGSVFLGRMTQLSDGMSVLLERNPATR